MRTLRGFVTYVILLRPVSSLSITVSLLDASLYTISLASHVSAGSLLLTGQRAIPQVHVSVPAHSCSVHLPQAAGVSQADEAR